MCCEGFEGPRDTESLVRLTCRRDISWRWRRCYYCSSDSNIRVSFNMSLCAAVSNRNEKTRSHFLLVRKVGLAHSLLVYFSFFFSRRLNLPPVPAEVRNCQRHISISLHLVSALDGLNWNYLNKRNTKIQIMFWSRAVNNFIQAFNQLLCWRCGAELCNYVYIKSIGDIKGKYIEVDYIFFGDQGFPFRNMHTQKEIDESHVLTEIEWRHFSWELFGVHWKCLPTFEILKRLTT